MAILDPRARARLRASFRVQLGASLVVFVLGVASLGPILAPHDPDAQASDTLLTDDGIPVAPFVAPDHWLGGDVLGRDELSRLLHGGAVSLSVAIFATIIAVVTGVSVGVVSGYVGGVVDTIAMRTLDVLLSIPFLLLAIAVYRVVESPGVASLSVLLGLLSWTTLGRVVRAKTLQLRELEFVEAARALGASHARVVLRHVLPSLGGPVMVLGTTLVAQIVIVESAMSFLGLGVRAPDASWGSMLREGQEYLAHSPRLVLFPGALVVATVFGFNMLGEGLRDALDPKG